MKKVDFWEKLDGIKPWNRGDERAPNKPLLLLLTLARYSRGASRFIQFSEIEADLKKLLIDFGPTRAGQKVNDPFWRLQKDGFWELKNAEKVIPDSSDNAKVTELRNYKVAGGFSEELFEAFCDNRHFLFETAYRLLELHFPPSLYSEILSAVGMDFDETTIDMLSRRRRDPHFRELVLDAYQGRCAVCGFDLKMGNKSIALEAAHIKWDCYQGPNVVENGIFLCSIHHELFDRGAWTLGVEGHIHISNRVKGTTGLQEWLLRFQGERLRLPQNEIAESQAQYLQWHRREVFKGENQASK